MKKFIGMLIIVGLCGSASAAVVTNATIMGTGGSSGVSTDLFQNATVTASSPTNTQFLFFDVRDIFTAGSPIMQDDVVFADTNGTVHHVEFNTADSLSLRRVRVVLANDNENGDFSQQRAAINFKLYARDTAGAFTVTELVADIDVEENYTAAYGSASINAEVTFPSAITSQYFRLEFEQPVRPWEYAPRVLEVDAFDWALEDGGVNILANGGFEDTAPITVVIQNPPVVDGSIAEWRAFNTDVVSITMEVISNATVAAEGTNYLQVTSIFSGATGQDGGIDRVRDIFSPQTLAAGSTYTVSFDLQHVSGINSVAVQLDSFLEGTDTIIENYLTKALTPSTGAWTHYSYEINPAADGVFYAGFRPKIGAQVQTEVFLLDNLVLELVPFDPDTVTNATFTTTGSIGDTLDVFQNATVTADSGVHAVANIADLFSSASAVMAEDVIFEDVDGDLVSFVEFNLSSAVSLTNININLQNDYDVDGAGTPDHRSLTRIKVYAGLAPSPSKLVADIVVDPEYTDAYGGNHIMVDIDLAVDAQYFQIEFHEPGIPYLDRGVRVYEVDGFGTPYTGPVNSATILSWSAISSSVMKMVVNIPGSPTDYNPQATTDLISIPWGSVAHSDDGVNAFVVTNMDYSTIDASGTNKVIYMQSNDAQKFFNIGGN